MGLSIIHTGDWHLGQLFYDYDRADEHRKFFDNLIDILKDKEADVLLVCGDVFDTANPSAAAAKLYYSFLKRAVTEIAGLQIIIIAGNHDSPSRLEAPRDILEHFNVTVVGMVESDANGEINYSKLLVPLYSRNKKRLGFCMAVPFIRQGDYAIKSDRSLTYNECVAAVYRGLYNYALSVKDNNDLIIAMGHLHAQGATASTDDRSERLIMGGLELLHTEIFNKGISYTALGHIHRNQVIDSENNIHYSGSVLPMSFSERNYKHCVKHVLFDDDGVLTVEKVDLPVTAPLIRVPEKPEPLNDVLLKLNELPSFITDKCTAPYLEVQVAINGPEPSLKAGIEEAVKDKAVRLAKITPHYPVREMVAGNGIPAEELEKVTPLEVFRRRYQEVYNSEVPFDLLDIFNEVTEDATKEELVS